MNKIKTFFAATLLAIVAVATLQAHLTSAASASDFDPSYIIDDYVFYNSNAMSADQIQNFLNSKVPVCDTQGTGPSGYGNTRAQYAASRGWHGPPYTCLRDYRQNTPQMEAASGLCGALSAKSNSTSAQIIRDVAAACNINPQVLVILLEKEQSLITDVWPLDIQLKNATGFACPDTAPCNPQYEGFFYQIYYAARQFKIYQAYPDSYNYRAGRSNNIYWHPDMARCGSSSVYIQNQATAALYIYTPYRPNQAALNNLYGTGDSCSSYGNRNFWRIFTDWFGSTKISYTPVENIRWMEIKTETHKVNPNNNSPYLLPGDSTLKVGQKLKFVSKIFMNGQWYLRSEYDHNSNINRAVPASAVQELTYSSFARPRWMNLSEDTKKYLPHTEQLTGETISRGTALEFTSKVQVNGIWYYRTKFDSTNSHSIGIPWFKISELEFDDFELPRFMEVSQNATIQDASTGEVFSEVSSKTQLKFNKKISLGDTVYYQQESDNGTKLSINSKFISEIVFEPISEPRWMALNKNTYKLNPLTDASSSEQFSQGLQVHLIDQIIIQGNLYYRTAYDKNNNNNMTFKASDISPITYVNLENPRTMTLMRTTSKLNALTGKSDSIIHSQGTNLKIQTKLLIQNEWYFRTQFDTLNNSDLVFRASDFDL